MKRIFTISAVALLTATLWAQSPEKMSYQAVIRDANNNLVASHSVGMKISILQGSASGTAIYIETQSPSTNVNGLVSIEIGGGTVVSGNFASINWANGTFFIKTETDPTGGTTYTITGTSQLLSVPYALHAKMAESIIGGITEADPEFTSWDKSIGISITESQISDLGNYLENETDPIYSVSQASKIKVSDITKLSNLSGINTGDQDGSETKIEAGANVWTTGSGTYESPYIINASDVGFSHYIGELYEGGIIVAVWKELGVEHGLIASLTDVSSGIQWSSVTNVLLFADRSNTEGQSNTTAMIEQGDLSGAGYLCDNYSYDGYSDWYLPALIELEQCYNASVIVNRILGYDNGLPTVSYWSSTSYTDTQAICKDFFTGQTYTVPKQNAYRVRAVRRF